MVTTRCPQCNSTGVHDWDCHGAHPEGCDKSQGHECRMCGGSGTQSVDVYANVYSVTREYGGPEEGGWWYDAGEPLGSIRIDPLWDEELIVSTLRRLYAGDQSTRGRHSVIGGPDVVIRFEPELAESFPAERPHYE